MSSVANSAFSSAGTVAQLSRGMAPSRLIVGDQWTGWRSPVMARLEALVQLERGWDGYGAPPVKLETAYFTMQMLKAICPPETPSPQIVPGSNGDLQVEWHYPTGEIELHVRAPNSVAAWRVSPTEPDGEEIELTNDFLVVLGWVREMLGAQVAAVTAAA